MLMITKKRRVLVLILLLLLAAYCVWALARPLPALRPQNAQSTLEVKTPASQLAWPGEQAAVGILDTDTLEVHGDIKPAPTASTAKIITALMILKQKPLNLGQTGPSVTLTQNDVDLYKNYLAQDGSLLPVLAGEQISEYQMLQALLLPSANNIADTLAIWAYGSLDAYSKAANQFLAENHLNGTHAGSDASGLNPSTTSTVKDLVKLGEMAMRNPVLAQITGQTKADGFPVVGSIKNVNDLIGMDGIIGIKTGNSDQAGGVYVSASQTLVNGKPQTVITAVMGAPTLFASMKDSLALIKSAQANFKPSVVVKAGQVVGDYKLPWGGHVSAVTANALSVSAWQGSSIIAQVNLKPTDQTPAAGEIIGHLATAGQSVNLQLQDNPPKSSILWRLAHPFH